MGRCVDVSPTRQVESPILGLVSVSWQGPREATTRGGLVRGAHPVAVDLPSRVRHQNVRRGREKESELGSQARKGKFIRGKREGAGP